jgi:hypothetical protein
VGSDPLPSLTIPDAARNERIVVARQDEHRDGREAVERVDRSANVDVVDIVVFEQVPLPER